MKFKPINLSEIKTSSIKSRKSKVNISEFSKPWSVGKNFKSFLNTIPNILIGKDFKQIVKAVTTAVQEDNLILFAMGAHVIKCGLSPIIVDLIKEGIIKGVALNGAGMIHDFEIAYMGSTSEDVQTGLKCGIFGMGKETADILNDATSKAASNNINLGYAIGKTISELGLPHRENSIAYTCFHLDIPLTIHIAIGTDIIHMHPSFHAEACGKATFIDFKLFTSMICQLEGGVYFNIGSAVILPEVFLKAISIARNLGHKLDKITTVNLDFTPHYRPIENVVKRPILQGKGYFVPGSHEIMIPLLAAAIKENLHSV